MSLGDEERKIMVEFEFFNLSSIIRQNTSFGWICNPTLGGY